MLLSRTWNWVNHSVCTHQIPPCTAPCLMFVQKHLPKAGWEAGSFYPGTQAKGQGQTWDFKSSRSEQRDEQTFQPSSPCSALSLPPRWWRHQTHTWYRLEQTAGCISTELSISQLALLISTADTAKLLLAPSCITDLSFILAQHCRHLSGEANER